MRDLALSTHADERQLAALEEAVGSVRERLSATPEAAVQLDVGAPSARGRSVHEAAAHGTRGSGSALPHADRIKQAFGRHDVSRVRAFVGGAASDAASAMGANAFAVGDAVAFRGAPSLFTAAHEAAHVVQQRGGVSLHGGVGSAGDRFERHADRVAHAVVEGRSVESLLDGVAGSGAGATSGVQRETSIGVNKGWYSLAQKADAKNETVKPIAFKLNPPKKFDKFVPLSPCFGGKITPKVEGELMIDARTNQLSGNAVVGIEGTVRLAPAALMSQGGVDFKVIGTAAMSLTGNAQNLTLVGTIGLTGEVSFGWDFFDVVQFEHKFFETSLIEIGKFTLNMAYGHPPRASFKWEGVNPADSLVRAWKLIQKNPARRPEGKRGGTLISSTPTRREPSGDSGLHSELWPSAQERNARAWRNLMRALGLQKKAAGGAPGADADGAKGDEAKMVAARGVMGGGGGALPHLETIQRAFGHHDVSGIDAHVGGPAAEASDALGAEAYATGRSVAFRQAPDLHTAAHEAAHVVQQRAGVSLKDGVGRAGDAHEVHADAVADAVVRGESAQELLDTVVLGDQPAPESGAVQRATTKTKGAGKPPSQVDAIARIARDACPAPQVAKQHAQLRGLVASYLAKNPKLGPPLADFFRTYVKALAPKGLSPSMQFRVMDRLIKATAELTTTFATQSQGYNCALEVEKTLIKIYRPEVLLQLMTNELRNATPAEKADLMPALMDESLGNLAGSTDRTKGLNADEFRTLTKNVMGWTPIKTQTIPETNTKLDNASNALFKWSLSGMRQTMVTEVRSGRLMTISLQAEPGSANLHKLLVTKFGDAIQIYDPGYGQRYLLEALGRPPLSEYGKVITWEVYQVPKVDPSRTK